MPSSTYVSIRPKSLIATVRRVFEEDRPSFLQPVQMLRRSSIQVPRNLRVSPGRKIRIRLQLECFHQRHSTDNFVQEILQMDEWKVQLQYVPLLQWFLFHGIRYWLLQALDKLQQCRFQFPRPSLYGDRGSQDLRKPWNYGPMWLQGASHGFTFDPHEAQTTSYSAVLWFIRGSGDPSSSSNQFWQELAQVGCEAWPCLHEQMHCSVCRHDGTRVTKPR